MRETAAAAFEMSERTLMMLGVEPDEATRLVNGIRLQDANLLFEQLFSGIDMAQYQLKPQPLTEKVNITEEH